MVTLLDAQAVQVQLKLRSRAKAIEIMARLPHIDLAPPGSRKRNLRGAVNVHESNMGHMAQMLPFAGL